MKGVGASYKIVKPWDAKGETPMGESYTPDGALIKARALSCDHDGSVVILRDGVKWASVTYDHVVFESDDAPAKKRVRR